jgi:flagellar basal-body rod protein FlgG
MSTSALQVARTGLDAQAERMRIIANNLANVNTTAFQRDRAEFATLAYQTITAAGARSGGDNQYATGLNLGTGVRLTGTGRITSPGSINTTGNNLDLAIEGEGYFQIQRPDGSTGYTRAGNFHRSSEGKLVTTDGMPVMPEIQIPENAGAITIGQDGTVSVQVTGQDEAQEVGKLELARFINPAGLQALGNNLYAQTGASGTAQTGPADAEGRGAIRQGALEASNVNVVQELVDMIETQRAYEVNSKMIQSTDEMLRNANQQL